MSAKTILVLHRIPFANIQYDRVVDHQHFNVIYIGSEQALCDIPDYVSCEKWSVNLNENWLDIVVNRVLRSGLQIERILGMSEYQLESAAKLRERLGVSGATLAQVQLSRDKVLMKEAVAAAQLRVPFFCSLVKAMQQDIPELVNLRVVLKPKKGASSEDIQVFESMDELLNRVAEKRTHISAIDQDELYADFEVEEFVVGEIWHIDGFTKQGVVEHSVASQYVGNCLAFAQGHAFGSVQMPMPATLATFSQAVVSAVEIENGSFHLEVFKQGDQWVFLEIGHRCGGADVVQSFLIKTGVNLYHAHISTQLDLQDTFNIQEKNDYFGWFVFPGHHLTGGYAQIIDSNDYQNHPFVVRWNQLPKSIPLTKQITYQKTQVPVAGVFCCPTSEQGIDFLSSLFTSIVVNSYTPTEELVYETV